MAEAELPCNLYWLALQSDMGETFLIAAILEEQFNPTKLAIELLLSYLDPKTAPASIKYRGTP